MTTGDVASNAIRAAMGGDTAGSFRIITAHVREAPDPIQAMYVLAVGYASVAHDDDLPMVDGLPADDADMLRTLVAAVRSGDLAGGWLLWGTASAGSMGSVLGGLLAVAVLSARREAGL